MRSSRPSPMRAGCLGSAFRAACPKRGFRSPFSLSARMAQTRPCSALRPSTRVRTRGRICGRQSTEGPGTMSFDLERAAALLADARTHHRQVEPFKPGPLQTADAYAVQDAVARRLGGVRGWKVGAKGPHETPNAAPLVTDLVRPSP